MTRDGVARRQAGEERSVSFALARPVLPRWGGFSFGWGGVLRGGGLSWDYSVVSSLSPDAGAAVPGAAEPPAEPFSADGGPVGVLVLHGFTGSTQTIHDWAASLAAAGLTVRAPLLAGHGGSWQDLAKTGWTDWYADAARAFPCARRLLAGVRGRHLDGRLPGAATGRDAGAAGVRRHLGEPVAGGGHPADRARAGAEVRAAVAAIDQRRHQEDRRGGAGGQADAGRVGGDAARDVVVTAASLASVTAPVLVFRSSVDHVVGPASMKILMAALPGTEVRRLDDSYHVATLDNDAPEIFDGTLSFIQKHVSLDEKRDHSSLRNKRGGLRGARSGGEAGIKDCTVADGDVPGGNGTGGNTTGGDGGGRGRLAGPDRAVRRARARARRRGDAALAGPRGPGGPGPR